MNNTNITPDFDIIELFKSKNLSLEELGLYVMLWAISDKSLILHNITDLSKLGNCGTDKIRALINKLIEKKLLVEFRKSQRIYFFKVLQPSENYETVKMEFLGQ
jgi:predicted transcriptional regulator